MGDFIRYLLLCSIDIRKLVMSIARTKSPVTGLVVLSSGKSSKNFERSNPGLDGDELG